MRGIGLTPKEFAETSALLDQQQTQQLGAMHAASFAEDPKHLLFMLARYHFVARMLQGKGLVLEVGCGDGTGARLVVLAVNCLIGMDTADYGDFPGSTFQKGDIRFDQPDIATGELDAVYALDVLEHIHPSLEESALVNMTYSLKPDGVCIIGMPSLESQPYASENSRREHVNCKTELALRRLMQRFFTNVFMFGMQDATLHTGFDRMAHYRLALCTGLR